MKYNILIAEDDADIVELLALYLDSADYRVFTAYDGIEALDIIKHEDIDVALVDIMMPRMNGYEFIKEARLISDIPMMIISARNQDVDKIMGLDIGADAYISKPFNPLEVIAYIKALLRRYSTHRLAKEKEVLKLGELELDMEKFILRKNGLVLPLTLTELKVVAKMMKTPERVYTKAQLYECINGEWYESDDNTMMVHISNIRSKIEDDPAQPQYIKTVRGLGYKIENKKKSKY